ncbi:MAG: DNA repair protein RecO [Minisyncoccales bacterium]
MFIHYRTQGIVLKKTDLGEADQLLTIYTRDFGKLEILSRGARKISAKLKPATEIFCWSEIEFVQGKSQKRLTDAILIDNFKKIRKDLLKLTIAFQLTETINDLIKGQEPDEKIWQHLIETFQRLNNLKPVQPWGLKLYYYFFWLLISFLGYQPELYHCRLCQKKLTASQLYFSAKEGGLICQNCYKRVKLGQEIDCQTIKILRIILKKDWLCLARLKLGKTHFTSLANVTEQTKKFLTTV